MENLILAVILAVIVIALSTVSDRLGAAPPLILMLVGVGISFLPFINPIEIEPEWILAVILPPLLYGAAIAIPTVDLRRDFSAVGGLAIILVVISAVVVGFIVHWMIPGVSIGYGIALGAILSPTDAAATAIVRRLGVPVRVRIILQGESLLNDATALVLLRSAIAATAVTVSMWQIILEFIWAAAAAAVIGVIIGWIGVRLRRLVHESTPATAISILLPFLAYLPAELVEASGLVAVVAAGLTAAQMGPKHLDARQRLAERANWHTIEFLLEGAVFLAMGLELKSFIIDVRNTHDTLWMAVGMSALALAVSLVLRSGYVTIALQGIHILTTRKANRSASWMQMHPSVSVGESPITEREQELMQRRARIRARLRRPGASRENMEERIVGMRSFISRYVADVDYLIRQPLGVKEGALLTWAGLRGVVTLAAAQTLPHTTPHRSLMILIAFFVAAGSLLLQGGTLSWVVKLLKLDGQDGAPPGERDRLQAELQEVADEWEADTDEPMSDDEILLAKLRAQREELLELRSTGTYTSQSLASALTELDAAEMGLQVRLSEDD
ncbi:MAG: sodium:proton antiporter [Propionibacteriaceae bacterium]|nr:sodium:proton antiporter [Propionibacteriaceae bacterium]